jgi:hypothetical protein
LRNASVSKDEAPPRSAQLCGVFTPRRILVTIGGIISGIGRSRAGDWLWRKMFGSVFH